MTIQELYTWIEDNPFVKEGKCWCDFFADYFNREVCSNCGHANPHTFVSNNYKYCDAPITERMMGNEVKEAILQYINEKST